MSPTIPTSPTPWQAERDAELEAQQEEHNERTGGGPV
jgi:hypothetical protein